MKITVSKKHIISALRTNGKRNPVEIAIIDLDCFEEVRLTWIGEFKFRLELDAEVVPLPLSVQKALNNFYENGTMLPISFELSLYEQVHFAEEAMLFETVDNYYGFGMNY